MVSPRRALPHERAIFPEDRDDPPTLWRIRSLRPEEIAAVRDGIVQARGDRDGEISCEILVGSQDLAWVRFGLVEVSNFGGERVPAREALDLRSTSLQVVPMAFVDLIPWPVIEFLAKRVKRLSGVKKAKEDWSP